MQDDMHPNILRMLEGMFLPDVIQLVIEIYITAFFMLVLGISCISMGYNFEKIDCLPCKNGSTFIGK